MAVKAILNVVTVRDNVVSLFLKLKTEEYILLLFPCYEYILIGL